MKPDAAKFTEFVQEVGELFFFDDLQQIEISAEAITSEPGGIYYVDVVREETDEAFRFFLFEQTPDLNAGVSEFFDRYRDFEIENEEEHEGSVLVWKGVEDDNFRYMFRTESGEIGLFFSEFSSDEDDEDDDEDEDEDDEDDEDEDEWEEDDEEEEEQKNKG